MGDGSEVIDGFYYSKEHEYVKIEGDLVIIGITDHAQNALHEITYVEIKDVGNKHTGRRYPRIGKINCFHCLWIQVVVADNNRGHISALLSQTRGVEPL